MKKIELTINCCKECPYLEEVVYFFRCKLLYKSLCSFEASELICDDCPLEEVLEIGRDREEFINRFEILDL